MYSEARGERMQPLTINEVCEMLYQVNRRVSLSIVFQKNLNKQHRLIEINQEIAGIIKTFRKD